ncbi:MAG TPA: response regulator transcription factor [Candidatus Saccharimonadales bacterium]|jgi:CheY-like chemotaxis protein
MRKILLVEDEDLLRETTSMIISSQPYLLDVAENGQVALEKTTQAIYDLILLDLMMPVMNGVEFLQHFAPVMPPQTRVIVLSNLSSGAELDAVMKQGAHRSLLKANLSPKQLLAAIRYELDASDPARIL